MSAVTSPLVWEHVQPAAARRLLTGAIDAFAERGFQATTTRDIASRAGMSPAALYVHYPSKERLLFEISLYGHRAALEVLRDAGDPAPDDIPGDAAPESSSSASVTADRSPAERLRAMVSAFTAWHAEHHTIARVVQYELAALTPEHLAEVAAIRRAISAQLEQVLADGVDDGSFAVEDLPGTTLAVLSLSIDVARWYTPHRAKPEDLGTLYGDLALRMVQA
ncbi:transcriptional regulator, TetR family [Kribbella flavida DSM 17836]|uniref:Transcriptional regulator, TetR family n=1 Tax=Kribbella flavida (strain DSM 17836 / JCM 10339 / NBRC 14399) TaxID=479435 RepID=D2PTI1_KRIFD|nr:TetR/AcrR family transcriptional regulator [Kribbella flavida]ADB31294.1 transcriptional regulator, TetR family [Kribbella flavida DSM 17836]